ncbi:MAG: PilZ domain-containing protein [Pseudomonadota bacterium]
MSSYYSNSALAVRDERDGERFKVFGRAELVRDGTLFASGSMIDLSKGGAAIRAYNPLQIGSKFLFCGDITTPAPLKVGPFPCTVTRAFANYGYAVRFDFDYRQSKILYDTIQKRLVSTEKS